MTTANASHESIDLEQGDLATEFRKYRGICVARL